MIVHYPLRRHELRCSRSATGPVSVAAQPGQNEARLNRMYQRDLQNLEMLRSFGPEDYLPNEPNPISEHRAFDLLAAPDAPSDNAPGAIDPVALADSVDPAKPEPPVAEGGTHYAVVLIDPMRRAS